MQRPTTHGTTGSCYAFQSIIHPGGQMQPGDGCGVAECDDVSTHHPPMRADATGIRTLWRIPYFTRLRDG